MKTKESSNKFEDGRGISPSVGQNKMQETAKLQGKNSGDGREQSYSKEITGEEKDEEKTSMNDITGKGKTEQEDVKKEFEIRSEQDSEKESEGTGKKREKDPVGELEEVDSEREDKDISQGSWRKSYKGDAEVVT
jgi:hypothetical protein